MKIAITILCLFISINVFAQTEQEYVESDWSYAKERYLEAVDADNGIARLDSGKGHFFKYINRKDKINKIEYWKYDTINDSLFQFQIKYSGKNQFRDESGNVFVITNYDEYFLISNGKLIYETDGYTNHFSRTSYNTTGDSMRWYEECYFKENKLVHYHSGGHGKSEDDDYNPEKEIPKLYEERYKELQFYLKNKHSANGQNKVIILSYKVDTVANHQCYEWNYPNEKILKTIVADMQPISGEEHHGAYNNYSCSISGEMIYNGKKYRYDFNAGGWVELDRIGGSDSDWFLLACKTKKYFKYFISTKIDPNDY